MAVLELALQEKVAANLEQLAPGFQPFGFQFASPR